MHDLSKRDSLVYWLEFKNDEEFDTRSFGSIAGGSALKFRIFRRKETGNWQAGGEKGNQPKEITKEEAIEYARSHRDQLLKGVELLDGLPDERIRRRLRSTSGPNGRIGSGCEPIGVGPQILQPAFSDQAR